MFTIEELHDLNHACSVAITDFNEQLSECDKFETLTEYSSWYRARIIAFENIQERIVEEIVKLETEGV